MAENKTQPTDASVDAYLGAIANAGRRQDCAVLVEMMGRITGAPATMWGAGIVGFGSYHYRYESGREGDAPLAGFSSRKGDISVYLMPGFEGQETRLARLGRHKAGKACLYLRKLADVDLAVLEELIDNSVADMRQRYASPAAV
ncbi:DUF1801 domain-containing protein [Massilia sp. SYSU DXS3249]